ncbi:MAG: ATP-binding protein [Proteobacteria bacterium]|nr:ATP-binding protein [Pseudomonadota bacterium]
MGRTRRNTPIFSSFTFKIFALFIVVGFVPLLASSYIFEHITSFNQDLQREADKSIREVSDFYRAWVKAEGQRITLTKQGLAADMRLILRDNGISTSADFASHPEALGAIRSLLTERIEENDLLLEIELMVGNTALLRVGMAPESPATLKIRQIDIPIDTPKMQKLVLVSDETAAPALASSPDDTDGSLKLPDRIPSIPTKASQDDDARMYLSALFGVSRQLADRYEILGERRGLHSSIAAMEDNDATKLSSLYQTFFIIVLGIVVTLVVACAILLAYPLSRRISELTLVTERVADGDLNAQVQVKGNDQIAFLMMQFNAMVRELKNAQESRAYVERMQAWQEVARRLAHEIKNPLTPLLLAMQQLDRKFDDYTGNPQKYRRLVNDAVEIVNEEAETLKKLVKDFTEFARLPIPEKKDTPFFDFVQQTLQLNPQFEEQSKRITLHPSPTTLASRTAHIDQSLMRRVIINVIRNGIEAATNAGFEPEIDIELREKITAQDESKLWLVITDNGPGLTPEQRSKLFTPYFTTKSDGTGLGLAIVRKIVQDHGGSIQLDMRDDQARGTQVDIIL